MKCSAKKTINNSQIEFICYSKFRNAATFLDARHSILNSFCSLWLCRYHKEWKGNPQRRRIADLFQEEIAPGDGIIIKPDAGTHETDNAGQKNRQEIVVNIRETKPSIINPIGVVAQELITEMVLRLRIIVYKEKGKAPVCHPVAFGESWSQRFRTNTYLAI